MDLLDLHGGNPTAKVLEVEARKYATHQLTPLTDRMKRVRRRARHDLKAAAKLLKSGRLSEDLYAALPVAFARDWLAAAQNVREVNAKMGYAQIVGNLTMCLFGVPWPADVETEEREFGPYRAAPYVFAKALGYQHPPFQMGHVTGVFLMEWNDVASNAMSDAKEAISPWGRMVSFVGRWWGPWETRFQQFKDRFPIGVTVALWVASLAVTAVGSYVTGFHHGRDSQAQSAVAARSQSK